jgi:hypothetical protein
MMIQWLIQRQRFGIVLLQLVVVEVVVVPFCHGCCGGGVEDGSSFPWKFDVAEDDDDDSIMIMFIIITDESDMYVLSWILLLQIVQLQHYRRL